ncbi:hypothetical protein N0V90_012695 [Kalmusia sp. IMI 367209]|nr:hypothetical protein N0V90_012695 [Kalmusia sp. IMI 367209]
MPSLKDLHCFIELSNGKAQLKEFGTTYGDGCVETFVAVPGRSQPFAIRLRSSKFIAPGLAMYVFIDGVYQCNRNRQHLKLRKPPDRKSLVDFVVRQKEEKQDDGIMMARDWSFERLNISSANEAPETCQPEMLDNIGCIEVIVLRCAGTRNAKSAPASDAKVKSMNLDGASDMPDHHFGLDGGPYTWNGPQYDDREWQHIGRGGQSNGYGAPTMVSSNQYGGPPPPLPHRSHAGIAHYNSPVHTEAPHLQGHWKGIGSPNAGYRYGSGPIPHQSGAASMHGPAPSAAGANAPTIDLAWLDNRLTDAVNRGFEKYHDKHASSQAQTAPTVVPIDTSGQAPGAWPSPFAVAPSLASPGQNEAFAQVPPAPGAALGLQSPPPNTRISWDHPLPTRPSHGCNNTNGWNSVEENNREDSWDEETWGALKDKNDGDDETRKRSVTTAPPTIWGSVAPQGDTWEHALGAPFIGLPPFSKFEQLTRAPSVNRKTGPTWGDIGFETNDNTLGVPDKEIEALDPWNKAEKETVALDDDEWGNKGGWGAQESAGQPYWTSGHQDKKSKTNGWDFEKTSWDTTKYDIKQTSWESKIKPTDDSTCDFSWKAALNGWSTAQKAKSTANQTTAQKSNPWLTSNDLKESEPKPLATDTAPKSHWQFPPSIPAKKTHPISDDAKLSAEPLPKISKEDAARKGLEHQVRAGKGMRYGHAIGRPEYLDSLERPYAVFRFKYRSHPTLRKLLGPDVVPSDAFLTITKPADPLTLATSAANPSKDVKQQLKSVPKDALIDSLLKLQTKLEKEKEKRVEEGDGRTEVEGRNRTRDWVKRQSRGGSEKEKAKDGEGKGGWSADESWGGKEKEENGGGDWTGW